MSFQELTPMLGVTDMRRSLEFYCGVLGFHEQGRFEPGGQLAWASLARGRVELMLSRIEHVGPLPDGCPPGGGLRLYLYCDDGVALREAVCGQDAHEPPTPEK